MTDGFPSLTADEFSGRKLGKYQVVCRLSTGGMAEILLAFQQGVAGFHKYVVLKILDNVRGEADFVRMFVQEAQISAAYSHPFIAQVYDLDVAGDELFLVMEFIPGATLVEVAKACLRAPEPIPTGFTVSVVRDIAYALHYAHTFVDPAGHSKPVVHRDVSEKNIMVSYEGMAKLLDFGIARRLDRESRTQAGTVKGTSGYMSPEQIRGEAIDARSDLFSLGVVLHECLSGQRLFYRKVRQEEMSAALHQVIAPPSRRNREVPAELDDVALKALERNKENRFANALEFAQALESAAGHLAWTQSQRAAFIKRHFSARQEQAREMLRGAQEPQEHSSVLVAQALPGYASVADGEHDDTDPLGVQFDASAAETRDTDPNATTPPKGARTVLEIASPFAEDELSVGTQGTGKVSRWESWRQRHLPDLSDTSLTILLSAGAIGAAAAAALVALIYAWSAP